MWLSKVASSGAARGFAALVIALALSGAEGGKLEAFTTTQAGYVCVDSDETAQNLFPPLFQWDDISVTGILVGAWSFDNATTFFGAGTPPWQINFLGFVVAAPQLIVNSNGYIQWTNGSFFNDNAAIPTAAGTAPINAICGFWDNLQPQLSPNSIRQQVVGVAPNRRMVVQWTAVPLLTGGVVTFQIAVFEQANAIRLQYQNLTGPDSNGNSATVGINSQTGTGIQYLFNGQPAGNALTNNLAIGFYPQGTVQAPWPVVPAPPPPPPAAAGGGARVDQHEDYDSTIDEFRAENCSAGTASSSAALLIACALAACVGLLMRPRAT